MKGIEELEKWDKKTWEQDTSTKKLAILTVMAVEKTMQRSIYRSITQN